jgi:hypothetical protein
MKYWINNGNKRGGFSEKFVEGSVEITDEYWETLIEQSNSGKIIRPDAQGYPVAIEPIMTAEQARSIRDTLIEAIEWRVSRYEREIMLGMTPTEDIEGVLRYIQALCDIPEQEGFPSDIMWPVL